MPEYAISKTLIAVFPTAQSVFGVAPSSSYKYGAELTPTGDGGQLWRGYPRTVWRFKAIPVTTYATAIVTTLGITAGNASGIVYVYTRNEYDTWSYYQALLRVPDPTTLNRWGGHYLDVALEFILLAPATPPAP